MVNKPLVSVGQMSVGQMALDRKVWNQNSAPEINSVWQMNDAANAAKLFSLVGNCDIDLFIFRRRFHIIGPKFLKFERFF